MNSPSDEDPLHIQKLFQGRAYKTGDDAYTVSPQPDIEPASASRRIKVILNGNQFFGPISTIN